MTDASAALPGRKMRLSPRYHFGLALMVSWSAFAALVNYLYASCLVTGLTLRRTERPMDTWEDLLREGYSFSYVDRAMLGRFQKVRKDEFRLIKT